MRIKYFLGVKLNLDVDYNYVAGFISDSIKKNIRGLICTTNPEFIVYSQTNHAFKSAINESLISTPDGTGIALMDRYDELHSETKSTHFIIRHIETLLRLLHQILFKKKVLNTVTGVDLMGKMCAHAAKEGHTVFLLGGWPRNWFGKPKSVNYDLASICRDKLESLYPGLKIVGATSSFGPKERDDTATLSYMQECIKKYDSSSIDILFIAYGSPQQELWYVRNKDTLPVKVCIGVGGSFDYISGITQRPSQLIRKLHLEWLYRLIKQPYRLPRTLNALVVFPILYLYNTYYSKTNSEY